jgi:hypothetical protein
MTNQTLYDPWNKETTRLRPDGIVEVRCPVTGRWVLFCGCGPHVACAEHTNCLYGDW